MLVSKAIDWRCKFFGHSQLRVSNRPPLSGTLRRAFRALTEEDQEAILAFLRSLVLYQTDQLPCDFDGDGRISDDYLVDGASIGIETFRPEWLLRVPCKIEGELVNVLGSKTCSRAVTNVRAAYGLDLDFIRDEEEDGWPNRLGLP